MARDRLWIARILGSLGSMLGFGAAAFVYWRVEPVPTMLAPVVVSVLPLIGAIVGRFRSLSYAAAFLMAVFAFLGGFSVGMLFVPSAALFVAAAVSESPGVTAV